MVRIVGTRVAGSPTPLRRSPSVRSLKGSGVSRVSPGTTMKATKTNHRQDSWQAPPQGSSVVRAPNYPPCSMLYAFSRADSLTVLRDDVNVPAEENPHSLPNQGIFLTRIGDP